MPPSKHLGLAKSFSEALQNARARWILTLMIATLVSVLSGGMTLFTILETTQIETLNETQLSRGKNVFLAVASPGQLINAGDCEKLSTQDGVLSSGSRKEVIRDLSGSAVAQGVTAGYIQTIWPEYSGTGSIVAGERYARAHHLISGSKIRLAVHSGQVDALAPELLRDPRANEELLVTQEPSGNVRECFVAAVAGAADGVAMLLPAWFSPTKISISPVYRPAGEVHPQKLLESRLSIKGSLVAGLIAGSALILSWLIRRSDFALYRLLGARNREIIMMLCVDASLFGALPMMVTSAWVVAFCAQLITTPLVLGSVLYASWLPALGTALAIPIGAFLLLKRDPHSLVREGS